VNLLAPALLAGMLALGVPVVAHLLGREPPRKVRIATLRFLRPAEPVVTRRRAIHDRALLLVRLLMLAALVLVLARPVAATSGGLAVVAEPHDAVVLIDGSRSMGLQIDGRSRLALAVERANALIGALPPGSRVGLVSSDPAGPRIELDASGGGHDQRLARSLEAWVEEGAPRAGGWLLGEALSTATAVLGPAREDRKRVIYAVGDRTARGLGSLPERVEGDVRVVPVPSTGELDEPAGPIPEHVSVDAIGWTPAPELDPRAVRIEATLTRHGGEEGTTLEVPVALRIGEEEVARARVEIAADASAPVEFSHTLLGAEPTVPATIELLEAENDPLHGDDARHVWLAAQDALDVTLVNGDPSELRAHDEVFFAATAINAFERSQPIRLHSLAPDQLEERIREQGTAGLEDTDVLVLTNLRAPAEDIAPAIVERVERGMGLWITVGDRVEAQEYNDRFSKILPLLMRGPSFAGTLPGRQEARTEAFAPVQLSHPMFAHGEGVRGDLGLAAARTRRLMLLEPDPERGTAIAVAFSSGAPALITRDYGQGRVGVLTTSVDRDWTDLPMRPGFVPLVERTLDYLGGTRSSNAGALLEVGETREFVTDRPLTVHTPTGAQIPITPDAEGVARFDETWVPGHYSAHVTGSDDAARRPVFAVGVQPEESDTDPVEIAAAPTDTSTAEVTTYEPRWRPLVILALLFLGLESVLRIRWSRARA
jgi:hypothetical protein